MHDTDESDGEGIGTSQDTKDITVAVGAVGFPGRPGKLGPGGRCFARTATRIARSARPLCPDTTPQCSGSSEIFCQIFWLIWAARVSRLLTVPSTTGSEVRSAHRAAVFAISETSSLQ